MFVALNIQVNMSYRWNTSQSDNRTELQREDTLAHLHSVKQKTGLYGNGEKSFIVLIRCNDDTYHN